MAPRIDPARLPCPFGPYQLLRRIAVGGMAEVYVALAKGMDGFEKLVALKLIHPGFSDDPHFVRMLVDEAKLSVLLTHSNIAQSFDLGNVDGRYFIVMEYVDGVDASKLLDRLEERREHMPIEAALFVMSRVCNGLDYAHRKSDPLGRSLNVIHRDVSPQNVLLGMDGDVKITDFGIAKAALRTSETEVGVIKGKYCYMSPEQAWADPIDQRSDIYSAGAVLYELLTGRMLVEPDENLPALLERVRRADFTPASVVRPEVPAELDAILAKALARKPDDRYETAGDFAAALEHLLFLRDRTYNATRFRVLMQELIPPAALATSAATAKSGEPTVVTKIEGQHGKMKSREFMPETSTSMIFGDSSSAGRRLETSSTRQKPTGPSTVRNLVEARSSRPSDPRVEPAVVQRAVEDDEEEATTFFSREAFASPGDASPVDDGESTLVDQTGDLAKRLDEMISLGGARRPITEPLVETKTAAFQPPAPRWEPLPFVGPPLEPDERPPPTTSEPAARFAFRPSPLAMVAAGLFVLAAVLALLGR